MHLGQWLPFRFIAVSKINLKLIGEPNIHKIYIWLWKNSSKYMSWNWTRKYHFPCNLMFRSFIVYMPELYIKGEILESSGTLLFFSFFFILYMKGEINLKFLYIYLYKALMVQAFQIHVRWMSCGQHYMLMLFLDKDLSLISYGSLWLSIITLAP